MHKRFGYNLLISLWEFLLFMVSAFHSKAGKMLVGRRKSLKIIQGWRKENPHKKTYWFHAASVGEFEQALPVIRLIKERQPEAAIAVSFFSPSGFEAKGKDPLLDLAFYLPADLPESMHRITTALRPEMLILVKYEFWYNLLKSCRRNDISVISICCILRENMLRNPFYREHLRQCLSLFRFFFVQNPETGRILMSFGLDNFKIVGDTRIDRVIEIRNRNQEIDWIPQWKENHKLLVVGSAWSEDMVFLDEFIRHAVVETDGLWRVLIVPHEIGERQLNHLTGSLSLPHHLFSEWKEKQEDCDVLILDAQGLLSTSYRYADAAWIGGGFKTGLHNTLEAAVYGIPVGFGPKFAKFREAIDLQEIGVARSFPAGGSVWEFFQTNTEEDARISISQAADAYFQSQQGASLAICGYILPE
jgi:3-deoxy-D-manno-octulosonic-acid transferase